MSDVIRGKDLIDNQKKLENLPEEFFELLDPDGWNVIVEANFDPKNDVRFTGFFKLKERETPYELYLSMPKSLYFKIVQPVDMSQFNEVH
jgi:hypothetical protein